MKLKNKLSNKAVLIITIMMMLIPWLPSNAQVKVPFTQRTSAVTPNQKIYNIKGDFQMIGNTNLTLEAYGDNIPNSNNQMIYVDVDNNPQTINSSSAELTFPVENESLPSCSNIIYAGLYWTGRAHDGESSNTFTVPITVPGSPITVNNNQTPGNNSKITYTNYSLTIVRSGDRNNRTITYTFTSSDTGNTVAFIYAYNSGSPTLSVSVNGATPTAVTTTSINDKDAVFSPYTIYNDAGGIDLTVNHLYRNGKNADINDALAYTNVTGTYTPPQTINKNLDKSVVYLKHTTETGYTTITASDINFTQNIYYPTTTDGYMYSAYAEVTDYVKQHGMGSYTVSDIALREGDGGSTGFYGGWAMIVVYENSKMNWRDITIFDGHAYIRDEANSNAMTYYELPVTGFHTAQSGAVNMKVGIIAGEGDRSIGGDGTNIDNFSIRNYQDDAWIPLSTPDNPVNNFFASSIVTNGVRNPSLYNNTGLDIVNINVPSTALTNNQTSTKFRYGTNQDTYIIPCIVMAVDAYVPELVPYISVGSVNGEPYSPTNSEVLPNGEIEYSLELRNPGTEQLLNAAIDIPIPYTATFVSASAEYFLGTGGTTPQQPVFTISGVSKFIHWNIGTIPKGGTNLLARLKFKLKATGDCFLLVNNNCSPTVLLEGTSSGSGETSGTEFHNLRFIHGYRDGVCQGEPIIGPLSMNIDYEDFVAQNCGTESYLGGAKIYNFCKKPGSSTIDYNLIAINFPVGSRFYNAVVTENIDGVIVVKPAEDATEYTVTTNFPATIGTTAYYAIPPGASTCWWEFEIKVEDCNLWYGGTDSNWGNTANWTQGAIPAPTDNISFATPHNYTGEALSDLILDQNRSVKNITNLSTRKIIIPANITLIVDSLANTGTASQVIIESDITKANGALIFNRPGINPGFQATIQFASKSKPGSGARSSAWQFFGVPVVDRTLADLFGPNVQGSIYGGNPAINTIVRKYKESLNLSYSYQEKWEDLDANSVLSPYYGYEITQPIEGTKHNLAGTIVTDDKTLNFTISPTGVYSRGNYILANPYTAPIFISKMLSSDFVNLAPTIYIFNTGSRQDWLTNNGSSQIGDLPGTYSAIPINAANTIGKTQIPSMQAFMVKAISDAAPATNFKFRYATVNRGTLTYPNEPMKVNRSVETENKDIKPLLMVDVIGENSSDRVYLITAEETGKSYDPGWDGYKSLSTGIVQLYTMDADSKRMQVNTDNDLNDTYIGFRTGGENTYTLRFKFNNEMNDVYESLYIQDLVTGSMQEITDGMTMNFDATAGTAEKRFKISGAKIKTGVITSDIHEAIKVTANSSKIRINNNTNGEVTIKVYNLTGQSVLIGKAAVGVQYISHNLTKGTYILEARSINSGRKKIFKSTIH
ncbi:MAG TPA: T9SS type A sorting domain-containing protein [Paludibacteraceae bacterium]|nr:T9SS type A sorting domain-containing protein [Paludibacteraceae bacterium]